SHLHVPDPGPFVCNPNRRGCPVNSPDKCSRPQCSRAARTMHALPRRIPCLRTPSAARTHAVTTTVVSQVPRHLPPHQRSVSVRFA
ncbi:unnamed protein product, partial [Pylaiella littoralis]